MVVVKRRCELPDLDFICGFAWEFANEVWVRLTDAEVERLFRVEMCSVAVQARWFTLIAPNAGASG